MNQIRSHPHRAGVIVEDDHGAGSKAASRLLYFGKVHGNVEMLFNQEVCRCASRKHSAKSKAVAHAAGVFFKDFAYWRAHRQFP